MCDAFIIEHNTIHNIVFTNIKIINIDENTIRIRSSTVVVSVVVRLDIQSTDTTGESLWTVVIARTAPQMHCQVVYYKPSVNVEKVQ